MERCIFATDGKKSCAPVGFTHHYRIINQLSFIAAGALQVYY
jgi:hypothetical protein